MPPDFVLMEGKNYMKTKLSVVILIFILLSFAYYAGATKLEAPPAGQILFIDSPEANRNYLAVIGANGNEMKRLTPAFHNIMFPRYNKKSGIIGFTNKTESLESEIYLLNKAQNRVARLLIGAALEDFSPDGKFLLYTTTDGKGELYVYSIERKRASKISQNLRITSASWSHDGEWICVSALSEDGTSDLYLISTLAQGIRRLTHTPGVNEAFPVFSKKGDFLVYFTDRYGKNEVEYYEIETGDFHRPVIAGVYPTLSQDDIWIAFQEGNNVGISRANGLDSTTLVSGAKFPLWLN